MSRSCCAQIRILKKKMQQIEGLEARGGRALDAQQLAKVGAKPLLESALALLEQGTPLPEVQALLAVAREGALASHASHAAWREDLESSRVLNVSCEHHCNGIQLRKKNPLRYLKLVFTAILGEEYTAVLRHAYDV